MLDHLDENRPGLEPDAATEAPSSDAGERTARRRALRSAFDRAVSVLADAGESATIDLDLLEAGITLGVAAEGAGLPLDALAEALEGRQGTDDSRLTSRRHDGDSLLTHVALKGFALAQASASRRRARELRHDLRNPLGAVRNSLVLLGEALDAGAPRDAAGERLRAMAARNVASVEEMIRTRLGDCEAMRGWTTLHRPAGDTIGSLGVPFVGTDASCGAAVDACALELAVRVAVSAGAMADRALPEVRLGGREGRLTVTVAPVREGPLRSRAIALLERVVSCAGGHMLDGTAAAGAIAFELPLSSRDERNDLARPGERDHGHTEPR